MWALFLKLSHLQDTPSTFRITLRVECERPAASWAETSYGSFCKCVKTVLQRMGREILLTSWRQCLSSQSKTRTPLHFCPTNAKSCCSTLTSYQQYGRLLILAGSASLLFISSPHVLPNVIFPLLQRLNEEDKNNESQ